MSILLAATAGATQPAATQASQTLAQGVILGLLFFTALAVILARSFRVFDRASVVGPTRVSEPASLGSLLFVFCFGVCIWLFAQGAYVAYRQAQTARFTGVDSHSLKMADLLTPRDFAILSTLPPLLGFLTLVIGNQLANRDQLRMLGISPRDLGGGFLRGVVGFLIIGPVVMWTVYLSEFVYRLLDFQHPKEHVLLKSLGQADNGTAAVMILIGATVMAPLFEELLFRGHFQTLLREFLARYFPRNGIARVAVAPVFQHAGFEDAGPSRPPLLPPLPPLPFLSYEPVIHARPPVPAPWHGWVAILITSTLFAMVHDGWSRPAIFVLAIGLGYVYERTGKLWTSITVHLLFNGFNTLQYWLLIRGH